MKDSPLVSIHDFGFLATLYYGYESLRKTELIAMNYLELSPGMEVVRRLLRLGFIEDFDDPDDRRAKRVRITKEGRTLFEERYAGLDQANQVVAGNLTEKEKTQLLTLLDKLRHFHDPIWKTDQGMDLPQLLEKYKSTTPKD